MDGFVFLIQFIKAIFRSFVNLTPHITDDAGNFSDLRVWVVSLDLFINFASKKEESGERFLRWRRLNKRIITMWSLGLFPIGRSCLIYK